MYFVFGKQSRNKEDMQEGRPGFNSVLPRRSCYTTGQALAVELHVLGSAG